MDDWTLGRCTESDNPLTILKCSLMSEILYDCTHIPVGGHTKRKTARFFFVCKISNFLKSISFLSAEKWMPFFTIPLPLRCGNKRTREEKKIVQSHSTINCYAVRCAMFPPGNTCNIAKCKTDSTAEDKEQQQAKNKRERNEDLGSVERVKKPKLFLFRMCARVSLAK